MTLLVNGASIIVVAVAALVWAAASLKVIQLVFPLVKEKLNKPDGS